MNWEIKFSEQAVKFFKKLDKQMQERIKSKFQDIAENPFRYAEHYEGDYYKFRLGDYRALADIDFSRKTILIRVFDKRGRIYK